MSAAVITTPSVSPPLALLPLRRRWTRDEFYRMGEVGFFQDEKVELVDGEIVVLPPQDSLHFLVLNLAARALENAWRGVWARIQGPLELGAKSTVEPDVAIVPGGIKDYLSHPKTALLVIEVSSSTLAYDRTTKASLYARAGLADYWLFNLLEWTLEVRRGPVEDPSGPLKFKYQDLKILTLAEQVSPLLNPQLTLPVAGFFPENMAPAAASRQTEK